MNASKSRNLCACTISIVMLGACSKTTPGDREQPAPTTAPAPKLGESAKAVNPERVVETYEELRRALADDELNAVAGIAKRLSTEASSAATATSAGAQKGLLMGLSQSASAVAGADMTQPDIVRKNFGEVSRHVVELVSSTPTLKQGRTLFECPMAQGYGRWVQSEPTLMNPYMGKKMLQCGSTVPWDKTNPSQ